MPTGYTYIVAENPSLTFSEFALRCARAFGALAHMRDDDMNAPITMPAVSQHSPDRLNIYRAELQALDAMSDAEWSASNAARYADNLNAFRERKARMLEQNARFQSMLDKVNAWQPPSDDHQSLKRFMVEQLTMSMVDPSYYDNEPVLMDAATARAEYRADLVRAVDHSATEWAKEQQRAAERVQWVTQLLQSLPDSLTASIKN